MCDCMHETKYWGGHKECKTSGCPNDHSLLRELATQMTQHTPIGLKFPKPQKSSTEPFSLLLRLFPYLFIFVLAAMLHTGSRVQRFLRWRWGESSNTQRHIGALWANRAPLPQRGNPIRWDRRWGVCYFSQGFQRTGPSGSVFSCW